MIIFLSGNIDAILARGYFIFVAKELPSYLLESRGGVGPIEIIFFSMLQLRKRWFVY
jgi:hypothetical protein